MKYTKLTILIFFFLALTIIPQVFALRPNYVYDRANKLTQTEKEQIDSFCSNVDLNSTVEIVVVTVTDLNAYGGDIDRARETIFNDEPLDGVKGIGKPDADNGVLIVVAVTERKWGIEIGYGLEGNFTDGESGRVGRDIMAPLLKEDKYGEALLAGVEAIALEVSGETTSISDSNDEFPLGLIIVIIAVIAVIILFVVLVGGDDDGGGHYSSGGFGGDSGGGGFGGGGSGGGGSSGGYAVKLKLPFSIPKSLYYSLLYATPAKRY